MGFPFDRKFDESITSLKQFTDKSPNMTMTNIRIQFRDEIIDDKKLSG